MKIRHEMCVDVNSGCNQMGAQFRLRMLSVWTWFVVVKCKCGDSRIARVGDIANGVKCTSCGRQVHQKHGMVESRTYQTWRNMKLRCLNPKNKVFKHYGGRGITICERWMEFPLFYEDMGDPADGMQLERVNNNLGYSKDNCVWATVREQRRNTRATVKITFCGETLCISDWAERLGINKCTLRERIQKMSFEEAISLPVKTYKQRAT